MTLFESKGYMRIERRRFSYLFSCSSESLGYVQKPAALTSQNKHADSEQAKKVGLKCQPASITLIAPIMLIASIKTLSEDAA